VAWFCAYILGYTIWHKMTVNRAFERDLQAQNIQYQRYYTNPTIFNNIVWSGVAEGDTAYYFSLYGFNDRRPAFDKFSTIPKNHHLLNGIPQDTRALRFLRWFSNGYYSVVPYNGDTLQVNDLRFGLLGDTLRDNNYVFPFLVFKNEKGEWEAKQNNQNRSSVKGSERSFGELWERVKGAE
jgi:inner membrane protein